MGSGAANLPSSAAIYFSSAESRPTSAFAAASRWASGDSPSARPATDRQGRAQGDIRAVKKAMRAKIKKERAALGQEYRQQASLRIIERLKDEETFQQAQIIFAFMPMAEEVQIQALFSDAAAAGKRFAFPVTFEAGHMEAFCPRDLSQLKTDRYGILAPDPDTDLLIDPADIDLILSPLLGFDRSGHRLGYGGGFYDRYLKRLKAGTPVIGLAYAVQEQEEIPCGRYDMPIDSIVTEREELNFRTWD